MRKCEHIQRGRVHTLLILSFCILSGWPCAVLVHVAGAIVVVTVVATRRVMRCINVVKNVGTRTTASRVAAASAGLSARRLAGCLLLLRFLPVIHTGEGLCSGQFGEYCFLVYDCMQQQQQQRTQCMIEGALWCTYIVQFEA